MTSSNKKPKLDNSTDPAGTSAEKFTFFWQAPSPFSQFHPSKFNAKPLFCTRPADDQGYTFLHCEQWMMFNKAKLFKDEQSAKMIMETTEPIQCKQLGRKVKNFDEEIWKRENERIVLAGNRLKFTQNPDLLDKLLKTEGTTLVEASPRDRLYGIGLSANNPKALDRKTWRGKNLLGEILTRLRKELKDAQEDVESSVGQ
ncbi:hypothetical protein HA402_010816 [Bradysia odoriphaga]|nr:hypothetical protein HA402_010816 [Bradysia odoriphaga]